MSVSGGGLSASSRPARIWPRYRSISGRTYAFTVVVAVRSYSCCSRRISLSSEILREQQEYERTATTTVNAYVRPLMERYLGQIRAGLDEADSPPPDTLMRPEERRAGQVHGPG